MKTKKLCKKKGFKNAREAHKVLQKVIATSNRDKIPKPCYFCEHCNHWHITSKDKI